MVSNRSQVGHRSVEERVVCERFSEQQLCFLFCTCPMCLVIRDELIDGGVGEISVLQAEEPACLESHYGS